MRLSRLSIVFTVLQFNSCFCCCSSVGHFCQTLAKADNPNLVKQFSEACAVHTNDIVMTFGPSHLPPYVGKLDVPI